MALRDSGSSSSVRFAAWQREYEAVLLEPDTNACFECMEIAEAAVLTRRSVLAHQPDHSAEVRAERRAIEEALARLGEIKRNRLLFR
jgi:hypothetical protein